jgi:hypothetical protein
MDSGNSKFWKIAAGLVLAVFLALGGYYFFANKNLSELSKNKTSESIVEDSKSDFIPTPSMGAQDLLPNVASPTNVVPAPNGQASFRHFELRGEGGVFLPSIIVVNEKDIVDITLKAIDQDYSFSLPSSGIYRKILKGNSGAIGFQISVPGKYEFLCADVCSPTAKGVMIVNSQTKTQ